jgi:hypothetical protein
MVGFIATIVKDDGAILKYARYPDGQRNVMGPVCDDGAVDAAWRDLGGVQSVRATHQVA